MTYLADPGGVFASDTHRRTLGHLPLPKDDPTSVEDLFARMITDVGTDHDDENELLSILEDLEADGYAGNTQAGWKQTAKGQDALTAPIGGEDG